MNIHRFLFSFVLLISTNAFASKNIAIDATLESLLYQRPEKDFGAAGKLTVQKAEFTIDDVFLGLGGEDKNLDIDIFYRTNFLGLQTTFGNIGLKFFPTNPADLVDYLKLLDSQVILDSSQLNISGKEAHVAVDGLKASIDSFRIYCQPAMNSLLVSEEDGGWINPNPVETCLNYMSLNGSYKNLNDIAKAKLDYADLTKKTSLSLTTNVKSIVFGPSTITVSVEDLKAKMLPAYNFSSNVVNLKCFKDPSLLEFDQKKIINDCVNTANLGQMNLVFEDKVAQSKFNVNLASLKVQDQSVNAQVAAFALTNKGSSTSLKNINLKCNFKADIDFLDVFNIIDDCLDLSAIKVGSLSSSEFDGLLKGLRVGNINLTTQNGKFSLMAYLKYLALDSTAVINGKIATNPSKKEIILTVVNTKLPFGINSVKFLMYLLRKNVVAKDISFSGNNIIITLH